MLIKNTGKYIVSTEDPTAGSPHLGPNYGHKTKKKIHFCHNVTSLQDAAEGTERFPDLSQENWPFLFEHILVLKVRWLQVPPPLPGWCCLSENLTFGQDCRSLYT